MAIGVNWKEIWDPVWAAVWQSADLVVVPDVVGQTQASAVAELGGDGFAVDARTAYSSAVAAGSVISQSPAAGSSASSGSTVTITVSLGERSRAGGRRRNYIIGDRKYHNITNEELLYLIARNMIDPAREDIKVTYRNKKSHVIPKALWGELDAALKRIESVVSNESDDDDAMSLLL